MQKPSRKGLFKYLLALALAAAAGAEFSDSRLLAIPETLVSEVADEVAFEPSEWPREARSRVLWLLSTDPRPRVRARVARNLGALAKIAPSRSLSLIERLARDESVRVRVAAAEGLERALAVMHPGQRIELLCQWATANQPNQREVLARALLNHVHTPVSDFVIDTLATDERPHTRLHAARAAAQHYSRSPAQYAETLSRLARDADARVARAARVGLNDGRIERA
ncbi:MAG TPA: HEAT repeat domain-containing protein [Polyangiaceae bacterium]|nr:HEAT repeat domain-containing protein [Polyangiaceae bacterium]